MSGLVARLEQRLREVSGLSPEQARHIAREALDLFGQTVEEFIESRHIELQREGYSNEAIYRQIFDELPEWRFRAPEMTLRQVRRRIYG